MTDFLTAVKTIRVKSEEPEEPLLTAVSQTLHQTESKPLSEDHAKPKRSAGIKEPRGNVLSKPLENWETLLQKFRSQPDAETVVSVLRSLSFGSEPSPLLDLYAPGPSQSQVIKVLVNVITPSFWPVFNDREKALLVSCLSSVSGIAALTERIRALSHLLSKPQFSSGDLEEIKILLNVEGTLFNGDDVSFRIWLRLSSSATTDIKRELAWKEYVRLVASGKVTSTVSQAEDVVKTREPTFKQTWLSSGAEFANWLGRNVAQLMQQRSSLTDAPSALAKATTDFLSKALSFGYPIAVIGALWTTHVRSPLSERKPNDETSGLLEEVPDFLRRQFLEYTLRWISTLSQLEPSRESGSLQQQNQEVSAISAITQYLVETHQFMSQQLLELLSDVAFQSSLSISALRATIATMSKTASDLIETLLEKIMCIFADSLFVNHANVLQQESVTQTLLITAGYVHRKNPMALLITARSSHHMQGVSNRLASSNDRARWLGMVVGTAVSRLVDRKGTNLHFGTQELETEEGRWFLSLTQVDDEIGTLKDAEDLLSTPQTKTKARKKISKSAETEERQILNGKPVFGPSRPPIKSQTEFVGERVTEVLEEGYSDEDDDLTPYAKPDSDPEDSDEDATLVNRHKPRPPVYIRDLMRMLRDDKDHDRFQLGIKHAAILVRKKSNFGGEVTDHAEELAAILLNLQDPFETDDFAELRLEALIAVLLSDVKELAPWLSKQAFGGDFSLSQRCTILSALGLGGRELAGLKNEDMLVTAPPSSKTAFPSKRLPRRLHEIYSPRDPSVQRLEAASKEIEHKLVKPLALAAADHTTAHLNAVKVRTFSSRMEVERTKRKPAPNQLAKIFSEAFFFPLVSRYQQDVAAYGSGSVFANAPVVLVTFLKTLALLLHASGPVTLNLPDVTTAFWHLVLSLRVQAVADISILEATLFSLLTILEINGGNKQTIVQENPKQLMETKQWVELVFERTGGGNLITEDSSEEARIRTLAAGVLVKAKEFIEAYQGQLMGTLP